MIDHRCVTRVTRLVAHVEQELLTVPEYLEVILVLELGSRRHTILWLKDKIHIMDAPLVSFGHLMCVVFRFRVSDYPFVTFLFFYYSVLPYPVIPPYLVAI
jgi:hypothetical protein